ncbi:MAG: decarboxylase [Alphaproteobacteria bacterium]|nr:MAG: decarboxylase [Alphaproteobacteria bacterium]
MFSAGEARCDRWQEMAHAAQTLVAQSSSGSPSKDTLREVESLLTPLCVLETFHAYPGETLMSGLKEALARSDYSSFSRITNRIAKAIITGSYRRSANAWKLGEEGEKEVNDRLLKDYFDTGDLTKPYFEVLLVTDDPTPEQVRQGRNELRQLRRPEDPFVYETVTVPSFEEAVLAAVMNADLQAVIIKDNFRFKSQFDAPLLRTYLEQHMSQECGSLEPKDYGVALARVIRKIRPELDVYLIVDSSVEKVASHLDSKNIRRIFYGIEDLMEIHLALMEGVNQRYDTPYFNNLKNYARRPIGTFHALPVARGKSVFNSHWIRDFGHFYGANIFLAESSATTGGLDSLLEPTGNIKVAQEKAARAFGCQHLFFGTNGTSTSNKIAVQTIVRPGDIVLVDRNCHKSHHYGLVICGGQPLYVEAYPLTQYSMYGAVPLKTIKKTLLDLKAEGKLDRARMLLLTNCTFDGHIYNVQRFMEEVLAIKPDIVFLWDEAWSAYSRFSHFHRMRSAMGACEALRERYASDSYRAEYAEFKKKHGKIDPKNANLLDTHLLPDPDAVKIRVYATTSTHKSLSCFRQGSYIMVNDDCWESTEASFKEAFFAHTSTSPNLQLIASLDVARRQAELEGYELVGRAIELALTLRREVNRHPLISKYFSIATNAQMVPAEYRASGLEDFHAEGVSWKTIYDAWTTDEFVLDPTRITLLCGSAGFDGTAFKGLLASKFDIQLNKTSRNSILLQTNINNTRSDIAYLIKVLADISRELDRKLARDYDEKAAFDARVKSLITDVPDLPNFSRFHDAFRENPRGKTNEGDMRTPFFLAYDAENCTHVKLNSKEIDDLVRSGQAVSAKFVIPYPPGFPIMVPGQVITKETIEFMRKLDVKEIHGYHAASGLELIKPEKLGTNVRKNGSGSRRKNGSASRRGGLVHSSRKRSPNHHRRKVTV